MSIGRLLEIKVEWRINNVSKYQQQIIRTIKKCKVLLIIASKTVKCLGTNVIKYIQDLYPGEKNPD